MVFGGLGGEKQSQFAGLRPEIRSTKLEILNLVERMRFEKTKPICQRVKLAQSLF